MTVFAKLRAKSVGGGVISPLFIEGDGAVSQPRFKILPVEQVSARAAGRNVVFATHGFNVSFAQGACALSGLEEALALPDSYQYIAILWPGDSWLPVVNYPFEGATATQCGRLIAGFCNTSLQSAASVSFLSHSLGARLVLEAVKGLKRPAKTVCMAAAAINFDCLTTEYALAFKNAERISLLASRKDMVLKLAYPLGDPIADLLQHDHRLFEQALGYEGPLRSLGATVPPWQIPDGEAYNHGDYLPPSSPDQLLPEERKWLEPIGFMKRALLGSPQTWPG